MKFMSAYYDVVAVSGDSDILRVVAANEGVYNTPNNSDHRVSLIKND